MNIQTGTSDKSGKRFKMVKTMGRLKYFIATDKYNLLRNEENPVSYFIKRMYYKLQLLIENYK